MQLSGMSQGVEIKTPTLGHLQPKHLIGSDIHAMSPSWTVQNKI